MAIDSANAIVEWERKHIAVELLVMWSNSHMLVMREQAWLALRIIPEEIYFDTLKGEKQGAVNAVINFFDRLRILYGDTTKISTNEVVDKPLLKQLFKQDAGFWKKELDKLRANTNVDQGLIDWYRDMVRPFMVFLET